MASLGITKIQHELNKFKNTVREGVSDERMRALWVVLDAMADHIEKLDEQINKKP
jgi:hypothetical protein